LGAGPPGIDPPFIQSRNAALAVLGFRAMLRPGELAKLRMKDVKLLQNAILVRLGVTKADQTAQRKPVRIEATLSVTCPVMLVSAFFRIRLSQYARDKDHFFVSSDGKEMSVPAISNVVSKMAEEAGIQGKFSGHSLRIGGASAALAAGFSIDQVKALGAWKSDAVNQYLQPVLVEQDAVSRSLGL